ncbi:GNAT family N-acetyltransferase [Paenibacillus kobensis]|uniref:GNAT family N-acetyltransferase n=1 Tax=Paenibacillus kobensis TaxID=59841 RepID=UPI0013E36B50|nr:GNAT family N-acetyltransferase [Paenibacillus kobensis]
MDIVRLKPAQWPLWRNRLLHFAQRYGDRRLTAGGLRALIAAGGGSALPLAAPVAPPSSPFAAVIAHQDGKLLGFAFAADSGRSACLVAVHPNARSQGVGHALICGLIDHFGGLCCHVASDNPASLRLFFKAGLKAVALEEGPTGKPTLLLQTDGFGQGLRRRETPSQTASSTSVT